SYPKASHTLRKRNILYLSQVVNEDGTHLLPRKLIAHRWQYRHGCQLFWLSLLEFTILKESNSRRLLDEWLVNPDNVPCEEPYHIDMRPSTYRTKDWLISYTESNTYIWVEYAENNLQNILQKSSIGSKILHLFRMRHHTLR